MEKRITLAIDPGPVESAVVLMEGYKPIKAVKAENKEIEKILKTENYDQVCIEMVSSYGMPVGKTIFETCFFIGRFWEMAYMRGVTPVRIFRKDVKHALCGKVSAKDKDVISALALRFAPGESNFGKGSSSKPGWFYGFKADIWQAYAVGVYFIDTQRSKLFY